MVLGMVILFATAFEVMPAARAGTGNMESCLPAISEGIIERSDELRGNLR
jgi:hypothetical protein